MAPSTSMYVDSIHTQRFRCFESLELTGLAHPNRNEQLRVPNINVLLGSNGAGKSACMVSLALAVLAPMLGSSGYRSIGNVRRSADGVPENDTLIEAYVVNHGHDEHKRHRMKLHAVVQRVGDSEQVNVIATGSERTTLFTDSDPRLFLAAYGTTRRTAAAGTFDPSIRNSQYAERLQRVGSLLLPEFTLIPLASWLPKSERQEEVRSLLDGLSTHIQFMSRVERDDLLVRYRGVELPWSALSDGYRSFFGWVGDLVYRLAQIAGDKKLTEIPGTVLVDELDLHLHPQWQTEVVRSLSTTFPRLQFIFTTHSPLIVGTLDTGNILILEQDETGRSNVRRPTVSPWGLSAEQLLLSSEYGFDLDSARDGEFEHKLDEQRRDASGGSIEAAIELQRMLAMGDAGRSSR